MLADDLAVDAYHGDMVMWKEMVSTIYILQVLLPHNAVDLRMHDDQIEVTATYTSMRTKEVLRHMFTMLR